MLLFLCQRPVGQSRLTPEETAARAAGFLRRSGFAALAPVSSTGEGGVQTVAFAATMPAPGPSMGGTTQPGEPGRVILYPDLVKVAVARDDGSILAFDATQYYVAHRRRRLPPPALSAEQARARAAEGGMAARPLLPLIPLPGGREELAWEVTVRRRDGVYLIYINAANGREERVARLVPVPGSALVQ